MIFNKKLLTVAVGGALTLGLAVPQAQAQNVLLFPYVVKDGSNRTTIVTVIADSSSLHIQYHSKAVTDANTAACQANSFVLPFTDNDMVTFDTGGVFGFPVLGDVTNSTTPPIAPVMGGAGSRHGYLVADQSGDSYGGYWLEVDLATAGGGLHGDAAAHIGNGGGESDGNFISPAMALLSPGSTLGTNVRAVQFLPPAGVRTEFTVTPLGTNMLNNENSQVTVKLNYLTSGSTFGVYDRNENLLDGGANVTVRCVGRVTLPQLLPLNATAAPFANGGWGWLANLGDNTTATGSNVDLNAIVYQVESVAGGGKYFINATRIATDDGYPFN